MVTTVDKVYTGETYIVSGRSRAQIRGIANSIRKEYDLPQDGRLNILDFIENKLAKLGLFLDPRSMAEMGNLHGLASPAEGKIDVREDVYEGAFQGNGRDRFTIAHELGHIALGHHATFKRAPNGVIPKPYQSSEWQADCFAAELLIPYSKNLVNMTAHQISATYGVSVSAASYQLNQYRKEVQNLT